MEMDTAATRQCEDCCLTRYENLWLSSSFSKGCDIPCKVPGVILPPLEHPLWFQVLHLKQIKGPLKRSHNKATSTVRSIENMTWKERLEEMGLCSLEKREGRDSQKLPNPPRLFQRRRQPSDFPVRAAPRHGDHSCAKLSRPDPRCQGKAGVPPRWSPQLLCHGQSSGSFLTPSHLLVPASSLARTSEALAPTPLPTSSTNIAIGEGRWAFLILLNLFKKRKLIFLVAQHDFNFYSE